jgi:hypothetical protein
MYHDNVIFYFAEMICLIYKRDGTGIGMQNNVQNNYKMKL